MQGFIHEISRALIGTVVAQRILYYIEQVEFWP